MTGLAFLILFWEPLATLIRDWWSYPDAAHGLLLAPLAIYLAWREGLVSERRPQPILGVVIIGGSVLLRYLSGLAAELFTMRLSLVGAAVGLIIFALGLGQIRRWWLSFALILLSIPLPAVVLGTLALPLQLQASRLGAALLRWRDVPTALSGNILYLPGRSLFVTEACSGLRSLTALLALATLTGGLWLRYAWTRGAVLLMAVPIAMLINGLRVFLTGFLIYWVSPELGEGFMHYSEGWALFVIAFGMLSGLTWALARLERRFT